MWDYSNIDATGENGWGTLVVLMAGWKKWVAVGSLSRSAVKLYLPACVTQFSDLDLLEQR